MAGKSRSSRSTARPSPSSSSASARSGRSNAAAQEAITPTTEESGFLSGVGAETGAKASGAPADGAAPPDDTPAPPASVTVSTPAGDVNVPVPPDTKPGGSFTAAASSPISGLSIQSMTVRLDEDFQITGGTASVTIEKGAVSGSGQLTIVDGQLTGEIAVQLTTIIGSSNGTATLTSEGLVAKGSATASGMELSNGLVANGGSLDWTQGADGTLEGGGQISGSLEGHGGFDLNVLLSDGQLEGEAKITLEEHIILGDAKVISGELLGVYSNEEMVVSGPIELGIGDWARGSSDGTFNLTQKTLTSDVEASVTEVSLGEVSLHSGTVKFGVVDNVFTGGALAVDASAKGFRGQATGEFNPEARTLSGDVAATWEKGEGEEGGESEGSGVRILGAAGTLHVEENIPTDLQEVSASVGIDIAGEQKIEAAIESAAFDLQSKSVSGKATGATTSPISMAEGAIELEMSEASADVAANTVTEVAGSTSLSIGAPGEAHVLDVNGSGTIDTVSGIVKEATGQASLHDVQLPLGPNLHITGLSGQASVTNNDLQVDTLAADWESTSFKGTAEGSFDPEAKTLNGELAAEVHQPAEFAGATIESGEGTLLVQDNAAQSFTGSAAGKLGEKLEYNAQSIDVAIEAKTLDGEVEAGLQDGQEVSLANVGTLNQLHAEGTIVQNDLERLEGDLGGTLAPGGEALLDFVVNGAYRTTDEVVETGTGTASLVSEKTFGPLTVDKLDAAVSVTENDPSLDSASVGFYTDTFKGGINDSSFDLEKKTVSGTASAELKAPLTMGALEITTASGEVEVTENVLGSMKGDVAGTLKKGENLISFEAADVDIDMEAESFSGTVSASTSEHLELLPGRLRAKINKAEGEIEDNELKRVAGDFDAIVGHSGKDRLQVAAQGEFDLEGNTIVSATGEINLLESFSLFNDKINVQEFAGSATIENNALTAGSLTALGELNLLDQTTNVMLDGQFKEGDEGFDIQGTADIDEFHIIKPNNKGRRLKGGMSGDVDTSAETFAVSGAMDYAINDSFGGSLDGNMDQDFDPGLKGSLQGEAKLVQATELFSIEKTIVSIPIPPIFGASLDAELTMQVGELTATPNIAITEEWFPVSGGTDLPDFETKTNAKWDVGLEGALLPYLYGGLKMAGIRAAVGGFGKASLSADAGINADILFSGSGGEFAGEVGLGVDITSDLSMSAGLFAELGVPGWDVVDWRKEDLVSYTMPDLFSMEWGKTFTFGDKGPGEKEGASVPATSLAPQVSSSESGKASPENSRQPKNTEVASDASAAGGPTISGQSALSSVDTSSKSADGGEDLSGLDLAMNALDTMKALFDRVGGAIDQLKDVPMGTLEFIWDMFTGQYDFDAIVTDVRKVYDSLSDLMEFVAPMLEGWFTQFWDFLQNAGSQLWSALFGNSAAFRKIINDGSTIHNAPPEMLVHLIEGALWDDMWTSGADEAACLTVMRVAGQRGIIDKILTPERTRAIFEELDDRGAEFKRIVMQYAPANVLRSELKEFTGQWVLDGGEERAAMMYIEAAASRGMLASVLSAADAKDILGGMDGSRHTRMRELLSSAGFSV